MDFRVLTLLMSALGFPSFASAQDAPAAPAAAPASTPGAIPIAQLMDAHAGEAFIGQEITIEGGFMGVLPVDAVEQIPMPKRYRKNYVRFALVGDAGSSVRNLIVPMDQATALYSMALGTKLRVTGTLEHILSPLMVQPIGLNRLLLVSEITPL